MMSTASWMEMILHCETLDAVRSGQAGEGAEGRRNPRFRSRSK